jgi:hypothetical protein
MRASRIFDFARTMRCATVGAPVRNARAISSVVRPHTSRSVSATCASASSAGWQHVKIRRSRSSRRHRSSHRLARSSLDVAAMSASEASNRARRRSASIALKRPVDTSQRARVGGHPLARPLLDGRGERLVHRLFGAIEVAEQPIRVARTRRESAR